MSYPYPQIVIYVPHAKKTHLDQQIGLIKQRTGKSESQIVREAIEIGLPFLCSGVTGMEGFSGSQRTGTGASFVLGDGQAIISRTIRIKF
jgi:hypothetical protein